jgi:uncharacterized membrane protein YbhN (UPF0104 family)
MRFGETIARVVRQRALWDVAGVVVSVGLILCASFALFHLLRGVDVAKIGAALGLIPRRSIILAGLLVAASYFMLTFYDVFAVRLLGHTHIPWRSAALTGFLSYTIGHTLGAVVLTAGLVRLRMYRRWGLELLDVGKIAFVTGLTFWLGNAVLLGLGLAYAPETAGMIDRLPSWLNRTLALTALAAIAVYLFWLMPRPRTVGRREWAIALPSASSTLVQIGIGISELGLAALAIYVLIAATAPVDIVSALVAYVLAALLGFVSHAPGGLVVFDAALLLALPQVEKEQLLAAFLIFRCLYYVVPFCLAISIFAVREVWGSAAGRRAVASERS